MYSASLLSWTDGVAWFSKNMESFDLMRSFEEKIERKRRAEELCRDASVADLSADQLLEIYELMEPYNVANIAHLERGLGMEEAIVRAEAIR